MPPGEEAEGGEACEGKDLRDREWRFGLGRPPRARKNSIFASQSSDDSGQPWLNTIGWPEPQSL